MPKTLWGLAFGPRAQRFLDKMQPGKTRAQVTGKARKLVEDAYPPGCKKLAGLPEGCEDVWRVRQGDYRILYVVRDTLVLVVDIDHRKDVYR